ncbi:hypothetical protein Mycch_1255 [Mycolicibacterium chubuense NBB4]|uniref:Transmembrane protein n=1 Tax=Mycolicibacterium chubuense (strain NBB4) TaxID=710421 RepID=I4BFK6_MYCCN|nr:hypothetical protein [Mycolicibacterium chubuense]AFM16063.1 hypothetical protein Mycch_1255 [Mycolicibacterium chubuense NBB4]
MADLSHGGQRLRNGTVIDRGGVREAVRVGLGFAVAGVLALLTASVWMSTCTGSTVDALACGAPQRAVSALAAPAIFLAGAAWAVTRSVRMRRDQPAWWAWSVGAAILLALTVISALLGMPSL